MGRHFAWALSAAIMVCACAYCTVQESASRKADALLYAKMCVDSGGHNLDGWGGRYCQYPK